MSKPRRLARSVALASFLGTSAFCGGAAMIALPEEAEAWDIDESYFYVSLSPYGNWVQTADFGWAWYPYNRVASWRPYTLGHWVWTDYGEWLWVSDEPFGWATYHYGRWYLDPDYGWVWLPGQTWAPAWVSWRDCDDYIGWSPLGPWGYWDYGYGGYRGWYDWDHHHHGGWDGHHNGGWDDHDGHHGGHDGGWDDHGGHHDGGDHAGGGDRGMRSAGGGPGAGHQQDVSQWNFTRKRDFTSTRIDKVVLDGRHAPQVFGRSRELPPPSEQDERLGRGVSRGIEKGQIERAAGHPIRTVKVEDQTAPPSRGDARGHDLRAEERGDHVRVYRPKVTDARPDATPDRLGVAREHGGGNRQPPGARGGRGNDNLRGGDRSFPGEARGGRNDEAPLGDEMRGGRGNDDNSRGNRGGEREPASRGGGRPADREPSGAVHGGGRPSDHDRPEALHGGGRYEQPQDRGNGTRREYQEPRIWPGNERPASENPSRQMQQPHATDGPTRFDQPRGASRPVESPPSYYGQPQQGRGYSPSQRGQERPVQREIPVQRERPVPGYDHGSGNPGGHEPASHGHGGAHSSYGGSSPTSGETSSPSTGGSYGAAPGGASSGASSMGGYRGGSSTGGSPMGSSPMGGYGGGGYGGSMGGGGGHMGGGAGRAH